MVCCPRMMLRGLRRTIADLAASDKTEEAHILEAVSYRISTGRED